jgi:hypothetical protein
MEKITRENIEKNYREAIIKKYRSEKVDGKYSHYLDNPSQALLRDLCWEIFSLSPKENDLVVYRNFFRFDFNSKDENTSITYTNKFKKVGAFFREDKVPAKITTVELAAILVDYEPRPFKKFREKGIPIIEQPIGSPKIPFAFGIKDKREEEIEIEGNEIENENKNYQEDQIANPANQETSPYSEEEVEIEQIVPQRISLFLIIKEKLLNRLKRKIKVTAIGVAIVLCVGFAAIYEFFPSKGCMQWTGTKYEIVDCDLKAPDNNIELLDANQVNMERIKVCDTTAFFVNEKAVVFYARSSDSLECFNQIGYHPERRSLYLKPITHYMIGRYVSNKSYK